MDVTLESALAQFRAARDQYAESVLALLIDLPPQLRSREVRRWSTVYARLLCRQCPQMSAERLHAEHEAMINTLLLGAARWQLNQECSDVDTIGEVAGRA